MREIIFITGGQRSGKSRFAQELAEYSSANPLYLATARYWDDDFEQRIRRHQTDRGEQWETIEEEKRLSSLSLDGRTVLLDCITLWLTNIFHDNGYKLEIALEEAKREWNALIQQDFRLIVVSNEIGMGLHAPDESSRHFTDLQGWINQHIAASADKVYLMISGIPLQIK
ncbi:bifunctional adenosylcobinamide kinase/adenosylcobinamide-phosphate guanylyltransferase [Proteiniphilum sp.]|jgi:adenosylcobinamide kinase/adenosylcobinamide-phosphate guanylyltransferase|uniref:bifunctional adenosylcobinamide kinase/adenosylcobinamide-phosphate guanylyltransferase n=1 Tax=Proteiniphilum sp. TaxID=1926877 RepID=UPI002B2046E1|nr:bifunctional adenosylcobinamide kinase/adenosylcobinamide-phosphate guanylyltransferase [Proteiniphilum sp.]MEA5127540.1 bifunctional adenosylcobinamide kinase/adenosylcobinamide-phosphate guanylyltransferase [Proteiniphilum sp.]